MAKTVVDLTWRKSKSHGREKGQIVVCAREAKMQEKEQEQKRDGEAEEGAALEEKPAGECGSE